MEELKLDPNIDDLANRLKKGYAEQKAEQQGAAYRPANRFKSMHIWYGAARKCTELQADPDDFLDAAFQYCSIPGGPYPQNLATRAMDRWYREHQQLVKSSPEEKLPPGETVYGRKIKFRIKDALLMAMQTKARLGKTTLSEVLLDEIYLSLELCPAFIRALLLPKDPAIMAKWGSLARAEIMSNPRLLKMLLSSTFDTSWL